MSKPPIRKIDPDRITGTKDPHDVREVQAAVVWEYLSHCKGGLHLKTLDEILTRDKEMTRHELRAAVDLLMALKLAGAEVEQGGVHLYVK